MNESNTINNETDTEIYRRNLEDAVVMIKYAKLDERHLTEVSQAIYYHSNDYRSNNLKLIELDEHILEQVEEGQKLYFKGAPNEKAVLCTDEKTYEIKSAEISNSLLLVPDLKFAEATTTSPLKSLHNDSGSSPNTSFEQTSESASDPNSSIEENLKVNRTKKKDRVLEDRKLLAVFHNYFECREIKPRYRKLYDILQLTRYSGPENEEFVDRKLLFTREQLLNSTQSSSQQFEWGLKLLRAFQFNGFVRVFQYEYEFRIIHFMLGLISENSWQLDEIERHETVRALEGIAPNVIVEALFNIYTVKSKNKKNKYTYKEDLVARCVAQNILQPGLKFKLDEFLSTWQEAVPEGMNCDEKYLQGLAVFDKDGAIPYIRSLSEYNLSLNIHERMNFLFRTKTKWTLEEIEPYIEYFTTSTISTSTLMAKHARAVVENGVRYYLAKH